MIWIALAFCVVAVIGALSYAGSRAWRLWRTIRGTARQASDALARVTTSAAAAETHAVGLSAGAERLAAATARLQEALAELAAIRAAAAEAQGLLASIRGAVPRK
ncbi:MAG: hypothetical protein ACXVRJ_01605 [Gaiellaceae bacterium]